MIVATLLLLAATCLTIAARLSLTVAVRNVSQRIARKARITFAA